MSSVWRTLITVVVLYAAYRGYVMVVTPLTVPIVALPEPGRAAHSESHLPTNATTIAETYLPDVLWAREATKIFKINADSFTFSKDFQRIEDDARNRVRLSPFAMVWFDPRRDDKVPYTMTCETAVIEFENEFKWGGSSPGRIVAGQLSGDVQITGPDGLELQGRDFSLSEEDGRMYSNYPVAFAYGPVAGQSEQVRGRADEIDFALITGDDSMLGKDMPRIAGIERVSLRKNVAMDLVIEEQEQEQPVPISIRCAGSFAYDVENLVAVLNENVEVSRPTHPAGEPEQFDRLQCYQLEMIFAEKPTADSAVATAGGTIDEPVIQTVSGRSSSRRRRQDRLTLDVELQRLRATGPKVLLTSDENDVTGQMQDLRYDVKQRTLRMLADERVEMKYGSEVLACADIELTHDEESQIEGAICRGQGQAWRMNLESGIVEVESTWSEQLVLGPDPETGLTLLRMTGDARVMQRLQRAGVVGDVLSVWLDRAVLRDASHLQSSAEGLPLRRVVAEQVGDDPVAMVTPTLHLETKRLEAVFEESVDDPRHEGGRENAGLLGGRERENADEPPVTVLAGEVMTVLTFDPVAERTDFSTLTASRDVVISRLGEAQSETDDLTIDGPFKIECETLTLLNEQAGHVLRLHGQPARIRLPRNDRIEGNDILFDRGANNAEVLGPGIIVVHVDRDVYGQDLDQPVPLSVRWREHMTFDGLQADFWGETETNLSDSVLMCEELHVTLSRRIDFSEDRPDGEKIEMLTVVGEHNVTAEFHEWSERTTVVGIRKMDVAKFDYDRRSGEFHAQGPGTIHDWRKGDGRRPVSIGPSAVSRANSSVDDSDQPWNYTQLKFAGNMQGNQTDRTVELKDRVEVTHAPVAHALDIFERGELADTSESAKNAVWLGSDSMNFRLVPSQTLDGEGTMEVVAYGNAEVEGQTFGATGHSISYDESKEQLTLRGGPTDAHIWQQETLGSEPRRQSAKTIQYIPSKQLIIDGGRATRFSQ